ncbi:hypothetical protein PIB30_086263 [Stylosanthes scabra]|uniref:Reverse transcriptase zinc-binding domain-containing protein n=1 Tax=Stylosanthes scabra TaxID=79078 RepID=A0ABU6VU19_9FABA|nr:hypothetical protein [Stylosanthes scabra]
MLWLALHNALATNQFRNRGGMAPDDLCKMFGQSAKDVLHCFWNCPKDRAVWNLLDPTLSSVLNCSIFGFWFRRCLMHAGLLILAAMWWIRMSRCQEIFQYHPWSEIKVAGLSRSLHNDILSTSQGSSNLCPSLPVSSWVPPPKDYCKVNCDASIFHERQLAGFGCVLRNGSGS